MFVTIKTSLAQSDIPASVMLRINVVIAQTLQRPVGYCAVNFLTGNTYSVF